MGKTGTIFKMMKSTFIRKKTTEKDKNQKQPKKKPEVAKKGTRPKIMYGNETWNMQENVTGINASKI